LEGGEGATRRCQDLRKHHFVDGDIVGALLLCDLPDDCGVLLDVFVELVLERVCR
jgi:hypothetical protein